MVCSRFDIGLRAHSPGDILDNLIGLLLLLRLKLFNLLKLQLYLARQLRPPAHRAPGLLLSILAARYKYLVQLLVYEILVTV